MFERFTDRARQVVVLAQDEARGLKHNYLGTEHILLGLVRENEGVAARILLDFDADAETIRNEIIRMLSAAHGQETGVRKPVMSRHRRLADPWAKWQSMLVGAALLGLGILIGYAIWG